ncbi:MAG: zf-HC2 domain-containing protein [Planctomycetes bacterium]|nr:zf-HC2 domain-containing protein [Planctomycetota bacterium]
MLRCRDISKLVSESMERQLPLGQRLQVRMHLMLCRLCAGFARQTRLLRRAAKQDSERTAVDITKPEATLSQEARERIKAALRERGA